MLVERHTAVAEAHCNLPGAEVVRTVEEAGRHSLAEGEGHRSPVVEVGSLEEGMVVVEEDILFQLVSSSSFQLRYICVLTTWRRILLRGRLLVTALRWVRILRGEFCAPVVSSALRVIVESQLTTWRRGTITILLIVCHSVRQ